MSIFIEHHEGLPMQPSEAARADGAAGTKRKRRSPDEQAALDAQLAAALARCDEERAGRRRQEEAFREPQFVSGEVRDALGIEDDPWHSWQVRGQIVLDADEGRQGARWRRYSARDTLRLAVAVSLHRVGMPASQLEIVLERIEAVFPISPRNRILASNIPCAIIVRPGGDVLPPIVGDEIDLDSIGTGAAIVMRMDLLIRTSLERLGYSITRGTADDMRSAVERMKREPDGEARP